MVNFRNLDLKSISRKAMAQYGFEAEFPKDVIKEVNALDDHAKKKLAPNTVDLRNLLWSSIDNSDSEDLDQIEYCEKGEAGEIHVKIAVADVDTYVPKDSPADKYARNNTTSVYAEVEIYPMLPDKLSKNLSSLLPDGDRLAMVTEYTVLTNGTVRPGHIYHAIVRNKAKLVYEEIGAWLEGTGPKPKLVGSTEGLEAQLRLQDEAAQRLGKYRVARGALQFNTLEAKAIIEHDKVLALVVVEENKARNIIENFMVAANGVMSGFLDKADVPTIQRVVRIPKDWQGISAVAKSHGTRLPATPDAKALSLFLQKEKLKDPERFPDLSLTIVKLLGFGEYVLFDKFQPRIGHFCLAVSGYTHGTAPNRRYVDLVIQRLLKSVLAKTKTPYKSLELSEIAFQCTERERASNKAERFMRKVAAAMLMAGKIGQSFEGIITGANLHGTYVRLTAIPAEGCVIRGGEGLRVGQKVSVKLVNLDPTRGFIDFEKTTFWPDKRKKWRRR
ncbi:Ribonuclease R [Candidatus Gugararchaeum adminiculabundum]|nr:Ribonuclease R [Candidatus Gugararchaeum adminiculabundum]